MINIILNVLENGLINLVAKCDNESTLFGFGIRLMFVVSEIDLTINPLPSSSPNIKYYEIEHTSPEALIELLSNQFNSDMLNIKVKLQNN